MNKVLVGLVAVSVLVGLAASAEAVQVKHNGVTYGQNVTVVSPQRSGTFKAGMMSILLKDDDGEVTEADAFCIDLKQNAQTAYQEYESTALENGPKPWSGMDVSYPMGGQRADMIRLLWGTFYDSVDTDLEGAAFQLAVWEIIFETTGVLSMSAGDVYTTTTAVATQAQAYLDGMFAPGVENGLAALVSDDYQCYVYKDGSGDVPPVPEPVTMVSAMLGLCGLGSYVRRRTVA